MAERHQREDLGIWSPVQAGSHQPDGHSHMSAISVPADLFKWKAVNYSYVAPDFSNVTTETMNNSVHNYSLGQHENTSSTRNYHSIRGVGSGVNSPVPPQNDSSSSSLVNPQPLKSMHNTPGYNTYQCKMCDQMFSTKSDMLVHAQQVHNKQDMKSFSNSAFRCSQCQKCFANFSYLSQHNRIHAGIKPYKCETCERKFTQLSHLQQHIRTHTGEKPYKCHHTGCGKAFSQLSNLQSHSRSHMSDKPYRCNSCYKCYANESGLREHIPKHSETKHIKTQICKVCGKAYTQETYLARHMLKHTGENLKYQHSQKSPVKQEPNEHSNLESAVDFTRILDRVNRVQENAIPSVKSPPESSVQFASMTSSNSSAYPYSFSSGLTTALSTSSLNPTLSHISSMSSPRFFPYDPLGFRKTEPVDRLVNDRLVNDRLVNDRLVNDRLVNDRIVNDRLLNERLVERNMNMSMSSRPENMLANSFLSLQHIKNYASQQMPPSYLPCSSGNSRL